MRKSSNTNNEFFMKRIISLANKEADIPSITAMSIFLYFAYTLVTAKLFYLQFSLPEILAVSLLFLGIIVSIGAIFLRFEKPLPLNVNFKNIITATSVFLLLVVFSITSLAEIIGYFDPFIFLETELGLGWNHDTAFHVSLIQSILNFGYPSIAQNGHPPCVYHVLSHYTDALILKITGLEPYDSYGLFVHFKFFTFVSSIVLAIGATTQRRSILVYLISIILLTPLILGKGMAVGSHGQWMASIVLLLSAPFIFSILFKEGSITKSDLLALFAIIVIISLGKVSSGLMLGSLVGSFVLARGFKQPSTYLFGAVLLLFFYLYWSVFNGSSDGNAAALTLSNISVEGIYHYFFGEELYPHAIILTKPILASVFILGAIFCLDPNKVTGSALFASIVSALSLYFLCTVKTWTNTSDIWFFQFGLANAILLMTYSIFIKHYNPIQNKMRYIVWQASYMLVGKYFQKVPRVISDIKVRSIFYATFNVIVIAGLVLFLRNYFVTPGFIYNCGLATISKCSLDNIRAGLDHTNNDRFEIINSKLPENLQLSLKSLYISGSEELRDKALSQLFVSRPLYDLRRNLDEQLLKKSIAKKNVALFIPKSIFNDSRKKFGGADWDQGLLIYAITGIQLIHGVGDNLVSYGFPTYANAPDALRINGDAFSIEKSCTSMADVTHIAIINQLSPPQIDIIQCKKY